MAARRHRWRMTSQRWLDDRAARAVLPPSKETGRPSTHVKVCSRQNLEVCRNETWRGARARYCGTVGYGGFGKGAAGRGCVAAGAAGMG